MINLHDRLKQAVALREACDKRIRALGGLIEQVAEAEENTRTMNDVVLAKIASPVLPDLADRAQAFHRLLREMDAMDGRWLKRVDRPADVERAANGTTVNGKPIEVTQPVPVVDGDRIQLSAWTVITLRRGDAR
ncbi:FHA domain-containing protein [Microtetraspora malaysiensis]|uniref:FHA domain-containing protein n=1 Tax=Microtetraspora malaysiensis TaxID=161358 RepID=UPI003D90DBAC